jgi:pilus assembly protein Flp/PilA
MDELRSLAAWVCDVVRIVVARAGLALTHLRLQTARGQGLVEYALILVLIAIVVIGTLTLLGRQTSAVFQQVNCALSDGQFHRDNGNGNSNRCR